MSEDLGEKEIYEALCARHWIYRVVPRSFWYVKCNGTCGEADPHTQHLSPIYKAMNRLDRRKND